MSDHPEIKKWADEVVLAAMRNLAATRIIKGKRRKIDSTGRLRRSLKNELVEATDALVIEFQSSEDYAKWVEEGRAPGKPPPVSSIMKWIKQKPLRLRDPKTGKFVPVTKRGRLSAAFGIATNIGKFGTRPTKFMSNAVAGKLNELPELIRDDFEMRLDISLEQFRK